LGSSGPRHSQFCRRGSLLFEHWESDDDLPLYVLCASLDVYGIEVPAEASAFIDGPSVG